MANDKPNPWANARKRDDARSDEADTRPRAPRDETAPRRPARDDSGRKPAARDDRPQASGDRPPRRDDRDNRSRDRHSDDSRPPRSPRRDDARAEGKRPASREPRSERAPRPDREGRPERAPRKDHTAGRDSERSKFGGARGKAEGRERSPYSKPHPEDEHYARDRGMADAEHADEQRPQFDRHNEHKIYGVNACMIAFKQRKEDIIRGYFSNEIAGKFGETMRYLAQTKKAYRVVDDAEMERITQSQHHGGACFLMKKRPSRPLADLLASLQPEQQVCLLILEGLGNPHNLGAILRSCANFDVPAVLVDNAALLQSGAAARVAEGGAEWVDVVEYGELAETLEQLRAAGFSILSTSSHQGRDLYRTELPTRLAILFGEESKGLQAESMAASELCIRIPGSNKVESLNVSLAAGLVMGEYWRQHRVGTRRPAAPAAGAAPAKPAKARKPGGKAKPRTGAVAAKPAVPGKNRLSLKKAQD